MDTNEDTEVLVADEAVAELGIPEESACRGMLKYARPGDKRDIMIDFETYYDEDAGLTVKSQGNVGYVTDPRFYAYMVSIVEIDEMPKLLYVGPVEDAPWAEIAGENWWAWNMAFDRCVFDLGTAVGKAGEIQPNRWDDAAALAVYLQYPRALAYAMLQFDGSKADKSVRAAADGKRDRSAFTDEEWREMCVYCAEDSLMAARFVYEFGGQWPEIERDLAAHTCEMSLRGFEIDWNYLEWGKLTLQNAMLDSEDELPWVREDDMKPGSKKGLAAACRERGIEPPRSLAQDDPELALWIATHKDVPFVNAMKRYAAANVLLKKVENFERRRVEGRTRSDFGFKYWAGHTGRWGGDSGTNVQGLHKDPVEDFHIRHCIVAPEGKKLMVFDYSQIEPRCLAWFAGDTKFLRLLADGFNPYEAHAAATMGWVKGDKSLKEENKELYALAKARVLGLGYGCGDKKFIVVAKTMANVDLTPKESKDTVVAYRAANTKITGLWTKVNSMLARASLKPKGQRNCEIMLPSGRMQRYLDIVSKGGQIHVRTEHGGVHAPIYGGRATENLIQAIARDVLAEAIVRLENIPFPSPDPEIEALNCKLRQYAFVLLFTVHDEVILEVDEGFEHDAEAVEAFESLVSLTPKWLPGCVFGVESIFTPHYLK